MSTGRKPLPETVISLRELRDLPEYSCSLPTGQTIGKRWRRDVTFGDGQLMQEYERLNRISPGKYVKPPGPRPSEWMIGEYVEHPDPTLVGIRWSWAVSAPGVPHRGKL